MQAAEEYIKSTCHKRTLLCMFTAPGYVPIHVKALQLLALVLYSTGSTGDESPLKRCRNGKPTDITIKQIICLPVGHFNHFNCFDYVAVELVARGRLSFKVNLNGVTLNGCVKRRLCAHRLLQKAYLILMKAFLKLLHTPTFCSLYKMGWGGVHLNDAFQPCTETMRYQLLW